MVWLQAAPGLLADRFGLIGRLIGRPTATRPKGSWPDQLAVRGSALASVADLTVDVAERTPDELTDVVLEALR